MAQAEDTSHAPHNDPRQKVASRESDADNAALCRVIEALLFVAGEALSIERLAKLTGTSYLKTATALQQIEAEYADRGIVVRHIAGGYRFATAPAARAAVEAYLSPPKMSLSPAAFETLAIIAHMQPATKAEIESLRGVNVDSVITTLLHRGLIADAGRRDIPGLPIAYKTTTAFLEAFGLQSHTEIRPIEPETTEMTALTFESAS
jgi:segregation and condensation protein B